MLHDGVHKISRFVTTCITTNLFFSLSLFIIISRVSRANHPPGSAEGTSLALEILRRFRELQMDHTWTESLYATLQFPDRYSDRSQS